MKLKTPPHTFERVMLIDDTQMDNFINEKMIEASRFSKKVYVCTNGSTALEFLNNLLVLDTMIDATAPQVIFVDLNMPVMDGFQFLEELKTISSRIGSPLVAILTSSVSDDDRRRAESILPGVLFLNKPLRPEMLDSLVHRSNHGNHGPAS